VARIFFLDLGAGRVLSANPDGSDLQTLVSEGRKLPDGLAVDAAAGHLYWTNMGNPKANDGSIFRSDLDGGNMTTIIAPGGTFTPKQLQIDTRNHKLYWSDREGMRVMRANVDGSNVETLVDTSDGDPRPGRDPTKWCVGVAGGPMATRARHLRQSVCTRHGGVDRRAQGNSPRAVHGRDAARHLPGYDRSGRDVPYSRLVPHGAGSAWLIQTRVAQQMSRLELLSSGADSVASLRPGCCEAVRRTSYSRSACGGAGSSSDPGHRPGSSCEGR
jgi:hypothetical protein